jgi:lipoate-protein ligase A
VNPGWRLGDHASTGGGSGSVPAEGPAASGLETDWRLLCHEADDGPWNMAVDEAVARAVGAGRVPPTLRFYDWRRPTLSVGYLQQLRRRAILQSCDRLEIPVVRRPTGGRAVLHADEVTYSVCLPLDGAWGRLTVADSFARLSGALLGGLRRLGVAARQGAAERGEARAKESEACFRTRRMPALLVEGRKLVGSAQRRWDRSLLQQGSLLVGFDPTLQRSVFGGWPRAEAACSVIWLSAILGARPSRACLRSALAVGWEEALGVRLCPGVLSAEEERHAHQLVAARYGDEGWTARR